MRSSCAANVLQFSHLHLIWFFLVYLISHVQAMLQLLVLNVQDTEQLAGRLIFRSIVSPLMHQISQFISMMVGAIIILCS